MKRRILAPGVVCLLLAAFGLLTPTLFGQASDSIIVGTVTDSSGSAVPSAAITATNKDTGVKYSTLTNSTGEYRLNNIPVGHYDISASAKGFTPATMANVELQLNHTVPVNLILAVGTVNTTVDVTEAAAMIDTSTAQVQTTYDSKAATDMAMAGISKVVNGAGIYNLSLLGAGVTSSGGVGQGTGPSIAGQRPENNAFNIDGVMNDAHYTTGPQIYVSNEAVAQLSYHRRPNQGERMRGPGCFRVARGVGRSRDDHESSQQHRTPCWAVAIPPAVCPVEPDAKDNKAKQIDARAEEHHPLRSWIAQDAGHLCHDGPKDLAPLENRAVAEKAKPKH